MAAMEAVATVVSNQSSNSSNSINSSTSNKSIIASMAKDRLIGEDYCRNCSELLPEQAWYCPKCGQKCTDGRITIKELLDEFFEAIFNVDSRFFLTVRALFVPGSLTNKYFIGKRKSYIHPLRLFLVSGIIFFTLTSLVTSKYAERELVEASDSIFKEDAYKIKLLNELDTLKEGVIASSTHANVVSQAFDTLFSKVNREDSITLGYIEHYGGWGFEQKNIELAKLDLVDLDDDKLAEKYEVTSYIGKTTLRQSLRTITQLDEVVSSAISQLIWSFLIMMIILGFILKLLYIRRGIFYVEHLIFSFHFHAFAFLMTSLFLMLAFIAPSIFEAHVEKLGGLVIIGLIYMFIAMKRVYKQSWGKTFIKFSLLNFSYLFVFTFTIAFSALVSYILF